MKTSFGEMQSLECGINMQTALNDNKLSKKVDKQFYKEWRLSQVKKEKFDKWFKTTNIYLEPDTKMQLSKKAIDDNITVSIPNHYSLTRVQREIGTLIKKKLNKTSAQFKITSKAPIKTMQLISF